MKTSNIEGGLLSAVYREFGSMQSLMLALQQDDKQKFQLLPVKTVDTKEMSNLAFNSKGDVLQAIQKRFDKGLSLDVMSMEREDMELLEAGVVHFGTWTNATKHAGKKASKWGKKFIEKRVRERVANGKGIDANSLIREDAYLFQKIGEVYGGMHEFNREFGILKNAPGKKEGGIS